MLGVALLLLLLLLRRWEKMLMLLMLESRWEVEGGPARRRNVLLLKGGELRRMERVVRVGRKSCVVDRMAGLHVDAGRGDGDGDIGEGLSWEGMATIASEDRTTDGASRHRAIDVVQLARLLERRIDRLDLLRLPRVLERRPHRFKREVRQGRHRSRRGGRRDRFAERIRASPGRRFRRTGRDGPLATKRNPWTRPRHLSLQLCSSAVAPARHRFALFEECAWEPLLDRRDDLLEVGRQRLLARDAVGKVKRRGRGQDLTLACGLDEGDGAVEVLRAKEERADVWREQGGEEVRRLV